MKKRADKGRRPLELQVGNLVLVKLNPKQLKGMRATCDRRLTRKYEGPFPIIAKVGKVAYKIDLPVWLKVHPVIHNSNLKLYHPDAEDLERNQSTRPAINLPKPKQKIVERILKDRVIRV
ncbi:hypothetical protein L6164_026120 [Bauhinia variegata]|uniref:Uncharacterized protein n=1 Tax=Bauhinia variegata TaxID=167791 RepID=A0ACB9LNF3_BAUVA|nr:hypothetical protein L6164_026120 [Bauhinia variegata]